MDIGKFKATRTRLVLWLLLPLLLISGIGLSTYAIRLKSEWELTQTTQLTTVLPKLLKVQQQAAQLVTGFQKGGIRLRSEDDLMSYLREAAQESGFEVDSLKVDRSTEKSMPVLTASVSGTGSFDEIQRFMGNVTAGQHLLSERSLKMVQIVQSGGLPLYKSDMSLALVMFDADKNRERSARQ